MKKKIVSIIASIVALALLVPVAIGTGAMEIFGLLSGSSFSSSYITFFNAKDDETSLYVKKTVSTTDPSISAPEDDEFEFTIELDGQLAKKRSYLLFNKDGKQIYNYASGPSTEKKPDELELEWKTDTYGSFTLKAGETAKFDSLAQGVSYKVTETPKQDYISSETEDGISGTLLLEGSIAAFENTYQVAKPGTLEVRKVISYPNNYEMPESPEFSFKITVGGKKYADKECEIKNLETDLVIGTGTTDSDGILKLTGNTYAVFENVPEDVDYKVEEVIGEDLIAAGWRISGESEQVGATGTDSGVIASFTNVLASFAVSKRMFGGITVDDSFDFLIVNEKGKPFGKSISYYLYDKNKQLIKDEEHPTGLYVTGTDGSFTLRDGQTAVFVGVEKGTHYGVRETSTGGYIQHVPTSAGGYTDKIVGDSVEILPFENAIVPSKTLLTVQKKVENKSEEGTVPDVLFKFQISKVTLGGDGTEVIEPLAHAEYEIATGESAGTYNTDADGYFTLRAWEVARFTNLKKGITYQVQEVDIPTDFEVVGEDVIKGTLEEDVLEMSFTNDYYEEEIPPSGGFLKVDENGDPLAGAVLELWDDKLETKLHAWTSALTEEVFEVEAGTYYIVETQAPDGYAVSKKAKIEVKDQRELQHFTFENKRQVTPPTGVEFFRKPLVKILASLVVVIGALVAVYFGLLRKKKRS